MFTLYGDGVHDDAPAIQQMLDSGKSAVILPVPEKNYAIGSTLVIHSGQSLILPETTVIKLLPQSNCYMLMNEKAGDCHISVCGGIWDYNNQEQHPHIRWFPTDLTQKGPDPFPSDHIHANAQRYPDAYHGKIMCFYGVTFLSVRNLTYKDPVMYAVQIGYTEHFTFENIRFDYNYGNPYPVNMDGIHIDGGCRFGYVHNVQGTAYDDMVALTASYEGLDGPISDIEIDGVYGLNSLRGVRLLSTHHRLENISVSNVYGTFYQNPVSLTFYHYEQTTRGVMDHISIKNVFASNAPRLPIYRKPEKYSFGLIFIDINLDIGHLRIENVGRREQCSDIETISVRGNTKIGRLSVEHINHENLTAKPIPMLKNEGEIDTLYLMDIDCGNDVMIENHGTIKNKIES